ncbi:MAG: hypothetical protein E4G97_00580 [Deltaproteobacteria bacterium]|nr:MAG: hypothetical protein E4G97_00580 [Deltaproteobacteria bacterium]
MRTIRTFFAGILCFTCIYLVPVSFAGNEFVLVGGTHAVIEGKKFILIDRNSKHSVAPNGKYDTRDGRYTIVVKGDEIVIRDHTKELR